jgi:NAD(P)-dependent dehydrogenase (short-subunit alcohol dehydrogenase family)
MLADISEGALADAKTALNDDNVATMVGDVSNAASVEDVVSAVVRRWGPIDILFSNAGNFGTVAPIEAYPEATLDAVYAVHVKGAFLLCRSAAPCMRDGGGIVITSSVAGTRGDPGVFAQDRQRFRLKLIKERLYAQRQRRAS